MPTAVTKRSKDQNKKGKDKSNSLGNSLPPDGALTRLLQQSFDESPHLESSQYSRKAKNYIGGRKSQETTPPCEWFMSIVCLNNIKIRPPPWHPLPSPCQAHHGKTTCALWTPCTPAMATWIPMGYIVLRFLSTQHNLEAMFWVKKKKNHLVFELLSAAAPRTRVHHLLPKSILHLVEL